MTQVRVSNEQPPVSDPALAEWLTRQFRQVNNALFSLDNEGTAAEETDIVNKITVSTTVTINDAQLSSTRINIILVQTAGITITLPTTSGDKIIWLQKDYVGGGTYTVVTP